MPKATPQRAARRHNPLEDDITATGILRNKTSKRKSTDNEENDEEHFIDSRASKNILRIGRELAEEDKASRPAPPPVTIDSFGYDSRFGDEAPEDEESNKLYDEDEAWGDDDEEVEEVEVDPNDLETYRKFMPGQEEEDDLLKHGWDRKPADGAEGQEEESVNLADLILEKIAAHEAAEARRGAGLAPMGPVEDEYELPPKVIDVYTKVGEILSRYKSGPLPKPFKILPTIPHWEDIIQVTEPEKWSHNACYQATRVFSAAKPAVTQRFLEMVILDRVREDIYETKKLNVHLFDSLKKSLYKPSAFFKGFLFPLIGSGTCTLREAHIISAVLVRVSIPVLHSAAALKGLCDIAAQEASHGSEGGGATNIFIRALLEKKYALPYQVIDALVFHFLRFRSVDPASARDGDAMAGLTVEGDVKTKLPVIWHQSLLSFAQRYKGDITEDQREALLDLLLTHGHRQISPEVRRELLAGRGRGVPLEPQEAALDGDDTMQID